MTTIFDNRFLGMTDEAAAKFAEMMDAENQFVDFLGGRHDTFPDPPQRHNLVIMKEPNDDDIEGAEEVLRNLENKKSDLLIELQDFEQTTRGGRDPFPGIGSRSTSAPILITRSGIVELTSGNIEAKLRLASSDPSNRITYFQKLAFRSGHERLDTVISEMENRCNAKRKTAENYRNDHHHKRAEKAEIAAEELRDALSEIQAIKIRLEAAGIEDVHARILSGRSINYRAKFPTHGDTKWKTTKFSIAHVAIVVAGNDFQIKHAPQRDRPSRYKCVGLFANIGIFLPIIEAETLGL